MTNHKSSSLQLDRLGLTRMKLKRRRFVLAGLLLMVTCVAAALAVWRVQHDRDNREFASAGVRFRVPSGWSVITDHEEDRNTGISFLPQAFTLYVEKGRLQIMLFCMLLDDGAAGLGQETLFDIVGTPGGTGGPLAFSPARLASGRAVLRRDSGLRVRSVRATTDAANAPTNGTQFSRTAGIKISDGIVRCELGWLVAGTQDDVEKQSALLMPILEQIADSFRIDQTAARTTRDRMIDATN